MGNDKIYSRKRIKIPTFRYISTNSKYSITKGNFNFKRVFRFKLFIILVIAILTCAMEIKAISPIVNRVCSDAAKAKATIITNDKSTEVMKNYSYEDFVKIYRDDAGNITMLQSNIITINEITSDIAARIQNSLLNDDESMTNIKFRKFIWY